MDNNELIICKEIFFRENFNIDQCLSNYTLKTDLETLRRTLKTYGNELHEQMAAILKNETEEIVNLAEYLTNLQSKVEDLVVPVSQLREEIKTIYDLIEDCESKYCQVLKGLKCSYENRKQLILKKELICSALYIDNMENLEDSIILERAVNKYSFHYIFMETIGLLPKLDQSVVRIGVKLTELVNKMFIKAISNKESEVIARCLRMYDNLGKQAVAEKTYQDKIVNPVMRDIFTERHLERSNQSLEKLFDEALYFFDHSMQILLDVAQEVHLGFNFILNSFWVEIDKLLRESLSHITAPGNPDLFQIRYTTTYRFLVKIGAKCGDENLVKTNESFKQHLRRFNLPVYYEIRYQKIACTFEKNILLVTKSRDIYTSDGSIWKLKLTQSLWKTCVRCFDPDVFIDDLAVPFIKLSMLIFSRYFVWIKTNLKTDPGDLDFFVIKCLCDLNRLPDFDEAMSPNAEQYLPNILRLLQPQFADISRELQEHLIAKKSSETVALLQSVAAIPRLYRRTNRSVPNKASSYMVSAIDPIKAFHEKFSPDFEGFTKLIDATITKISREYLFLVKEVLLSVCKTEKSLRRLKNRSLTGNEELQSSDTVSDEMKIRKQIELDVDYLFTQLYPLGLQSSKTAMDELKGVARARYED